jgi:3'(2'), 5'-bisphosphate nucleotidase
MGSERMSEQTSPRIAGPREPLPEGGTPPVIDAAFARWLADRAGQVLLQVRAEMGFADGKALKAAGDKAAHDLLRTDLARWRPADAVLSEEDDHARLAWQDGEHATVRPERLSASRVWIVDPLDGTREFSEEGRTDWAVHIALWTADCSSPSCLAAGAVAMPARHRTIATDHPPAYPPLPLPTTPPPPLTGLKASFHATAGGAIRIAASRTRPPAFVTALAEDIGAELVPMGSAGVKIAAVINGDADAYVHAGGQYEWDSAAPVAVASATGLHASRIDGSKLEYNRADPKLPDLVVCRKDLAPRLLAALQRHLPVI